MFPDYASFEYRDDKVQRIYKTLTEEDNSIFYKANYTEVFIASMAIGKVLGIKQSINRKSRSIPTSVFTLDERWLMISVALSEIKDISIIKQPDKILEIAEEYSNGGIEHLNYIYESGIMTNPVEKFEEKIREALSVTY